MSLLDYISNGDPLKFLTFKNLLRSYDFAYLIAFDKFLLAVESRDLSQADKSIIRVSPFQS